MSGENASMLPNSVHDKQMPVVLFTYNCLNTWPNKRDLKLEPWSLESQEG